jgi:chemotaxis protein MotB
MKKLLLFSILILSLSSCVSSKKYQELDDKFIKMRSENAELSSKIDALENKNLKCASDLERMKISYESMKSKYETAQKLYDVRDKAYKKLQASYDALSNSSSQTLAFEANKSKKLLQELDKKQEELNQESNRLKKMKSELEARSAKISQLESLIAQKDAKLTNLKNSLTRALSKFEGQGLKVEQRNGKVYISMENKLLFSSGSWVVKQNGKNAIQKIGTVLSANPDIEITIEGHTDNVPYHGKTSIVDNWDLSVKRATSVVRQLLKNKNIDPKKLIASGRSKYQPVADNSTSAGKAKNRRIEVILTPNLDNIMNLLN